MRTIFRQFIALTTALILSGCPEVVPEVGSDGQPCSNSDTCKPGYTCQDGICCETRNHVACGTDGNTHWFDSCDYEGELVEECRTCETCTEISESSAECQVNEREEAYQHCGTDGNVHWFNTCAEEGDLVEDCPEVMECVDTTPQTAECRCKGNRDPADNCQSCKNNWQDLGDDCGTCPDNWDPEEDCAICRNQWIDQGNDCGICPGNWDAASDCNACVGNWDPAADCAACRAHWLDQGDDCGTCPGNWDVNADCDACQGGWTGADCERVNDCTEDLDFTLCDVVTNPDYWYDICVEGVCLSPGTCGNSSCNAPGPHYDLPLDDVDPADYTRTVPVASQPVVVDNVTGLMWQGCAAGLIGAECDGGSAPEMNWQEALSYCDTLDWGGYTDWHLPDPYELQSIVDYGSTGPAIDPLAFPRTPSTYFWSSSSYAADPSDAWVVSFDDGNVWGGVVKGNGNEVRCARSGP